MNFKLIFFFFNFIYIGSVCLQDRLGIVEQAIQNIEERNPQECQKLKRFYAQVQLLAQIESLCIQHKESYEKTTQIMSVLMAIVRDSLSNVSVIFFFHSLIK